MSLLLKQLCMARPLHISWSDRSWPGPDFSHCLLDISSGGQSVPPRWIQMTQSTAMEIAIFLGLSFFDMTDMLLSPSHMPSSSRAIQSVSGFFGIPYQSPGGPFDHVTCLVLSDRVAATLSHYICGGLCPHLSSRPCSHISFPPTA